MSDLLRILHLEDNALDAEIIKGLLIEEWPDCAIQQVETEADFSQQLGQNEVDLILADYILPSYDGMSALYLVRQHWPEIPFIFVSGVMGEEVAIETLKNGATDYVLKNGLARLVPAVKRALRESAEHRQYQLAAIEEERLLHELRDSENKYRSLSQQLHSLLDAIPDNLKLLDRDLKVLWANESATTEIDKSEVEVIGQYCFVLWCGLIEPCYYCPVVQSIATGKACSVVATRPDNKVWDLRAIPLIDEQGEVVNVIELKRDITEHRSLEDQLRHAQKMEAVGTLTGGFAHDFNNILNVILGYSSMVLDRLPQDNLSHDHLKEVITAAERAAVLTKKLLAFSRKQVAEVKPVNINDLVTGLQSMLGRTIGEDVHLTINVAADSPTVLADAGQIEQVLLNIAANARYAMPIGGSLTICTGTEQLDGEFTAAYGYGSPGNFGLITVADTGEGMDADVQRKIFDPFFTTKGIGEGTGLGLSVSYAIIKQHSGYINVFSEKGKGTLFKIFLPTCAKLMTRSAKGESFGEVRGGQEVILIAEDEASVRELARLMLESFGYSVITAADGSEAVAKFLEHRETIQLLILDLIMPNKNGKEVYEEIVKLQPGVKTLFSSGYTNDIISKMEIAEGMELIHKPYKPHELLNRVRMMLDN